MKCAHCAEEIQDQAIKCRHCGEIPVSRGWQETYRKYAALSPAKRQKMYATMDAEQQREFERIIPIMEEAGSPVGPSPQAPAGGMKRCPKCGETVARGAYVCPHCHRKIGTSPTGKVVGCGCVALLLFFMFSLFAPSILDYEGSLDRVKESGLDPSAPPSMTRIGTAGDHGFYVVPEDLAFNTEQLYAEMKEVCGAQDFCSVLVWSDRAMAATRFPMTDEQMEAQVAQYNRNRNTGHDCFYLLDRGSRIGSSERGSC